MLYSSHWNHLTYFVRLVCFVNLVYDRGFSPSSEMFQLGISAVNKNFRRTKSDFYVIGITLHHLVPVVESELHNHGVRLFAFSWPVMRPKVGYVGIRVVSRKG